MVIFQEWFVCPDDRFGRGTSGNKCLRWSFVAIHNLTAACVCVYGNDLLENTEMEAVVGGVHKKLICMSRNKPDNI